MRKCISTRHTSTFGIDSNDGLGIGFTQMHPFASEVDLHTINSVHVLVGVLRLHLREHQIDVDFWRKLNLVFRHVVFWI